MGKNKLSSIPERMNMPELTDLFLSGNKTLTEIPADFFDSMKNLERLYFGIYSSIKRLPLSILKLKGTIKNIWISENSLDKDSERIYDSARNLV